MKNFLILILILFITGILSHNTQNENKESSTPNTFLIKTPLTKEQLKALLQEGETQLINLKKKKNKKENKTEEIINNNKTKEDGDNITTDEGLQREIEDEIMDDALHPIDEFHVKETKTSETKTLIAKNDSKFIDLLYEKKFGKIYAYLTFVFYVFALRYFNNLNTNKKIGYKNNNYVNYYEFMSSNDYLVSKNN